MHPVGSDVITAEGIVTVRGNVPFTAVVLETDDHNWYILEMTQSMRDGFMTPARLKVNGRLYLDDWRGRPFAHLEVHEFEQILQ